MAILAKKLTVELDADEKKLVAGAKRAEKEIDELKRKAAGVSNDFSQVAANIGSKISGIGADTKVGGFFAEIGAGTSTLSALAGPAAIAAGAIVGIGNAAFQAGGAVFNLLKSASDFGSEIKDFQDQTGLAAETISTLKFNLEQSGLSLDNFKKPLNSINKLLYENQLGNKDAGETLKKFGITTQDTADNALQKILKKIQETTDETQKMGLAIEIGGSKGAGAIRALAENVNGDLQGTIDRARELGITLSEEDVKAADDFGDTLNLLGTQAKAAGAKFALEFAPDVTSAMETASKFMADNRETVREWGRDVSDTINGVKTVVGLLGDFWHSTFLGMAYDMLSDENKTKAWAVAKRTAMASVTFGISEIYYGMKAIGQASNNSDGREQKSINAAKENESAFKAAEAAAKAAQNFENEKKDFSNGRGGGGGKIPKSGSKSNGGLTIEQDMRKTFSELGFKINRTFGKAINEGSLHPLGRAIDLSIRGKTVEELFQAAVVGIQKGWQLVDERVPRIGKGGKPIKQTGPHFHFEKDSGKDPSLFLPANYYGGEQQLAYLQQLDKDRIAGKFKGSNLSDFAKFQTDQSKKANDEAEKSRENFVKNREADDQKLLESARQAAAEDKAIQSQLLARKLIAEDEYRTNVRNIELAQLEDEKAILLQRKELTELSAQDRADIDKRLAEVSSDIRVKQIEAETDEYVKQRDEIETIVNFWRDLNKEINDYHKEILALPEIKLGERLPSEGDFGNGPAEMASGVINRSRADSFFGGFGSSSVTNLRDSIQNEYDNAGISISDQELDRLTQVQTAYQALGEVAGSVTNALAQGMGQLVENWVLYGEVSGSSAKKAIASSLAMAASQSTVSAIMETAYGIAALTPWGAAIYGPAMLHFKAAAMFGLIAAGTGLAGRAVAGDSFKDKKAVNSPDVQNPQKDSEFTRNTLNEAISNKNDERRMLIDTISRLNDKINSMSAGDVLVAGANQKKGYLTSQVISEMKGNRTQTTEFGKTVFGK